VDWIHLAQVPGALSLGVKQPGHEADHSHPSSAKVKYVWSYIYTPPIRLHGMVLSEKKKHRDNFTFTFYLDRDQWQALVNTVMNLCVLQKTGNFLTS
jgi:hypothetical protein